MDDPPFITEVCQHRGRRHCGRRCIARSGAQREQLPGSGSSIRLAAPAGTSETTTVTQALFLPVARRNAARLLRGSARFAPIKTTEDANLQVLYGNDGTRTRDLRRDRPVPAQPPQPAPTREYRLEQAVRPRRTGCDRLRPAPARQGLCSTCVVDVVTTSTTAGHGRSRDAVHSAAPSHWASASRWVGRRA
jgi:hypothetical protein